MVNLRVLINLLLVLPMSMYLQAQNSYNLKNCLDIALEKNFSLNIIRNTEAIANNNVTPGYAGYLPVIDASTRYIGSLKHTRTEGFDESRAIINGLNSNGLNASVDLNWDLFAGFRISTTYAKLKELKSVGELNTRFAVEELIARVVSEYYNLIQQERLAQNFDYVLKLSHERLRITQTHYELGSRSKLELLQAQVDLNTDSSKVVQQQQKLLAGQIRLRTLMGVLHEGHEIVPSDSLIPIHSTLNYEQLFTQAMDNNAELLLAARYADISELELKIVRSRILPYLRFNTAYGYAHTINNKGGTRINRNHGLDYGFTLGINVFDGANRRREMKNARLAVQNQTLQLQNIEQDVRAGLLEIYGSYRNNLTLLEMERENFTTARENYKVAAERYKLGELSGIEFREAQINFRDAEERLLLAEYNTKIDEISLLTLAGEVMDYI